MATASVTNTFTQTVATAAATMNTNFDDVETFMNSSTVHKDGSKTMTGALNAGGFKVTGLADPSGATDAATKNYVDGFVGGAVFSKSVPVTGVASGTISWDSEAFDVDGWMDPLVDPTTFVCPESGIYMVTRRCSAGTAYGGFTATIPLAKKGETGSTYYTVTGAQSWQNTVGATITSNQSQLMLIDAGDQFRVTYSHAVTYTDVLSITFTKVGKF